MRNDTPVMDEQLAVQRKLTKQLRWLNINLTIFGVMAVGGFLVVAFLLFQIMLFLQDAGNKVQSLQNSTTQQLDIKSQLCNGTDSFSTFLKTNTDACRQQ